LGLRANGPNDESTLRTKGASLLAATPIMVGRKKKGAG